MTEPVLAILRDASFYSSHYQTTTSDPNTWHIPKYHVAVPLPKRTGSSKQFYMTACGRDAAEFTVESDLGQIPERRKCKRPGCRQRWPN